MRDYDPNNFIIDYVFRALDKKIKKEAKKLEEKIAKRLSDDIVERNESVEDGYYTITINV